MNNNFENNLNETQFEDMRQQLNTLKKKLGEQEIVNDRIIRRSMRNEVNNITRRNYILMAVCLFMLPYGYWAFVKLTGISIAFWIGTCILMLICAGAIFYNTHRISDSGLMNRSLIEAREKVAKAKKFDSDWLMFGIPAIILWLSWFFYEIYQQYDGVTTWAFWGGCVGAIIGTVLGFNLHFRTQRQYQEIIDQIEDLTKE